MLGPQPARTLTLVQRAGSDPRPALVVDQRAVLQGAACAARPATDTQLEPPSLPPPPARKRQPARTLRSAHRAHHHGVAVPEHVPSHGPASHPPRPSGAELAAPPPPPPPLQVLSLRHGSSPAALLWLGVPPAPPALATHTCCRLLSCCSNGEGLLPHASSAARASFSCGPFASRQRGLSPSAVGERRVRALLTSPCRAATPGTWRPAPRTCPPWSPRSPPRAAARPQARRRR